MPHSLRAAVEGQGAAPLLVANIAAVGVVLGCVTQDVGGRGKLGRCDAGGYAGLCGLVGLTRIGPLVLCGLVCGFVGTSGTC
jgi:hypothetical protein